MLDHDARRYNDLMNFREEEDGSVCLEFRTAPIVRMLIDAHGDELGRKATKALERLAARMDTLSGASD